MKKRSGRPKNAFTARRRQVLDELCAASSEGRRLSLCELARRCGLYDYRHARRIKRDLERMHAI